eukprot:scaffold19245_cov199-Amphora_coffeaeformis.AAC.24
MLVEANVLLVVWGYRQESPPPTLVRVDDPSSPSCRFGRCCCHSISPAHSCSVFSPRMWSHSQRRSNLESLRCTYHGHIMWLLLELLPGPPLSGLVETGKCCNSPNPTNGTNARNMGYTYYSGTAWALQNLETHVLLSHLRTNKGLGTERAAWIKPLYLSHLLSSLQQQQTNNGTNKDDINYNLDSWVLYLDTDVVIMNHDLDLTRILVTAHVADTTGVIVSTDAQGMNTGVLLIRNNPVGQRILTVWVRGATQGLALGQNDQDYF